MMRVFNEGNKKMVFNTEGLRYEIKKYSRTKKITLAQTRERLSEAIFVSTETINGWYKGKNGPADLTTVKGLARALELADDSLLLTTIDGGDTTMEHLTDRQKTAAKRIYDICVWFLNEFDRSDGFNDYWLQYKDSGSKDPEADIYAMVEGMMNKVHLVIDQEYFDLHGCDIYDELCEFTSDDLYNIYDGKIGYAYRFEAAASGNSTTATDYDRAMIQLNTIIEKYV